MEEQFGHCRRTAEQIRKAAQFFGADTVQVRVQDLAAGRRLQTRQYLVVGYRDERVG